MFQDGQLPVILSCPPQTFFLIFVKRRRKSVLVLLFWQSCALQQGAGMLTRKRLALREGSHQKATQMLFMLKRFVVDSWISTPHSFSFFPVLEEYT